MASMSTGVQLSSAHLCKGRPRLWHLVPAPVHEPYVLVQAGKAPAVAGHVLLGGQFWPLLPLSHEGNNLQANACKGGCRTEHTAEQQTSRVLSSSAEAESRRSTAGHREGWVSAEHPAAMLVGSVRSSKARGLQDLQCTRRSAGSCHTASVA